MNTQRKEDKLIQSILDLDNAGKDAVCLAIYNEIRHIRLIRRYYQLIYKGTNFSKSIHYHNLLNHMFFRLEEDLLNVASAIENLKK